MSLDWSELFGLSVAPVELIIRGTAMYLFLFAVFRIIVRRRVGTIIGWNALIDWLNFRFPSLRRFLEPPPLLLVHDGRVLHRNLRHEFITEEELRSKLREQGVDDFRQVQKAHMEPDGQVSVVKKASFQ